MAVTIYDVARKAGVGIGTVSRAINNSPQIKPETKERILAAIEELGYSPHTMAQRLARRHTGILAAVMPFYTGHFYQELLRGIQRSLSKYEYDLIIYFVDRQNKLNVYLDRTLKEKRCDGVLVISMDVPVEYIQRFAAAKLPLIVLDRWQSGVDCVHVENEEGAYQATRYLISLGHRRIAMISGNQESKPTRQRRRGYERALRSAHIAVDEGLFISADMVAGEDSVLLNDGFNAEAGRKAMERLLRLQDGAPTAIFASSDILAVGAMKAAQEAGCRIPEDVQIIGFDDIELAGYLSLTTMKQPMHEMGKLAIERIMEKIETKSDEIKQICLKTELVERTTARRTATTNRIRLSS